MMENEWLYLINAYLFTKSTETDLSIGEKPRPYERRTKGIFCGFTASFTGISRGITTNTRQLPSILTEANTNSITTSSTKK